MKTIENGVERDMTPDEMQALNDFRADFAPSMADLRRQAHDAAMAYGNAITNGELSQWAGIEPLSWEQQRQEALIVRDGGELPQTAILPGLAEDKGVDIAVYAADVLANAARYSAILRAGIRLRRAASGLLDEAIDTPEALAAAVAALKAETDAVAGQLIG